MRPKPVSLREEGVEPTGRRAPGHGLSWLEDLGTCRVNHCDFCRPQGVVGPPGAMTITKTAKI